jgi:hypothetical protein
MNSKGARLLDRSVEVGESANMASFISGLRIPLGLHPNLPAFIRRVRG